MQQAVSKRLLIRHYIQTGYFRNVVCAPWMNRLNCYTLILMYNYSLPLTYI